MEGTLVLEQTKKSNWKIFLACMVLPIAVFLAVILPLDLKDDDRANTRGEQANQGNSTNGLPTL